MQCTQLQSLTKLHFSSLYFLTEFCPRHNNEQLNPLAFALDVHMHKTTIKLQIVANGKKLMDCFYSTTKQARTDAAQGTESGALNR